ncbi:MAG: AAA family ATPase [Opitutaceae bacterium]|nr:AAA family ATPase [Opitutaceae bacterium]
MPLVPKKPQSARPLLDGSNRARLKRRLTRQGNERCRIVLTGGPGGGKTTAADLFRREIGERVVIVPEAATLVFSGGFPRSTEASAIRASQHAIFHVQSNLEDVQSARYPGRILLCDRGTVDGAAYWPGAEEQFFTALGTTLEQELARYDGVIFFESAAVGGMGIEGGNPVRTETLQQAVALDAKLRQLWSHHPRFVLVRHNASFFKKISFGLAELDAMVAELAARRSDPPEANFGKPRKS